MKLFIRGVDFAKVEYSHINIARLAADINTDNPETKNIGSGIYP